MIVVRRARMFYCKTVFLNCSTPKMFVSAQSALEQKKNKIRKVTQFTSAIDKLLQELQDIRQRHTADDKQMLEGKEHVAPVASVLQEDKEHVATVASVL